MPIPGWLQGEEKRVEMGFPPKARCRGKRKLPGQPGAAQFDGGVTSYPSPLPQPLMLQQPQIKTTT